MHKIGKNLWNLQIAIVSLTVLLPLLPLVAEQTKPAIPKVEHRSPETLQGKKRVYVTLGPRNALPGHLYQPWNSDTVEEIAGRWCKKASSLLEQNGFVVVESANAADFSIELVADIQYRDENMDQSTGYYIVTVENYPENEVPKNKKRVIYHQYRLFLTNPSPDSALYKNDTWIDDGIQGFFLALKNRSDR